jgi:hypothetical protein
MRLPVGELGAFKEPNKIFEVKPSYFLSVFFRNLGKRSGNKLNIRKIFREVYCICEHQKVVELP